MMLRPLITIYVTIVRRRRLVAIAVLAECAVSACARQGAQRVTAALTVAETCDRSPLIITGARVWTPDSVTTPADVLVEDGRIAQLTAPGSARRPPGVRIIDGRNATLLPGLVDAHAHLTQLAGGESPAVRADPRRRAFPVTMRQYLRSGVTMARVHLLELDLGPELKRRAEDDCFPGPRLRIGGPGIFGGVPDWLGVTAWGVRDTADIRTKIGRLRSVGVDWIALHNLSRFKPGEVEAIVAHAHRLGLRVMTQGDTFDSMRRALALDVETIEYGDRSAVPSYPEDLIEQLARIDAPELVQPIGYYREFLLWMADGQRIDRAANFAFMDDSTARSVRTSLAARRLESLARSAPDGNDIGALEAKFRQLRSRGVKMIVGSDAGSPANFQTTAIWSELETWRRFGASAGDAIAAATVRSARVLRESDMGAVRVGARADFVLYGGDVREGALSLERVRLVAKGGVVFVRDGAWVGPRDE